LAGGLLRQSLLAGQSARLVLSRYSLFLTILTVDVVGCVCAEAGVVGVTGIKYESLCSTASLVLPHTSANLTVDT